MKIIICGAGKVGTSIAKHLVDQKNDVTVVDRSDNDKFSKNVRTCELSALKTIPQSYTLIHTNNSVYTLCLDRTKQVSGNKP